ncbi:phosphoribosylglycinamide formyltransferase [Sphingomonas sp. BGYR3]|uniref:phosphoribosylglycinamide formyltransferase n=1 Tax=Sphingomonas sp. BGYR3 TaxID=2975483 RepID=UPI0021A759EB|nr:phosphoribosylglycinamide formyltransferase [Sphingomonas sp. BGYR3]MDG5487165.1 phosphoribosylglycinamide formyltransferase [Sphingomonas sp. BGYR3]
MAKARLGVLISGRGSNMAALLYAARVSDCPYEIALVAANDPDAPGLMLAAAEGIATFGQSHKGMKRAEFDAIIDRELRAAGCTHVALAGYMRLLSPEFVEGWANRMVNIHPSLLPLYKGLHTHERAIEAGDSHGGCSVHLVTAELDDGPVLGQARVAILPGESTDSLAARVLIAEHQLYPRVVADWIRSGTKSTLDEVRDRALALPEAREKTSHGSQGFHVEGGKFFAYFTVNHHGDGMTALLVKASGVEEQAMLIERDPDLYFRPAYLGPSGWIGIRLDQGEVDWTLVEDWLNRSWRMAAPKRLTKLMDLADQF